MGSACCVAARDKTISNGSGSDLLHRSNIRFSPTWSFRWDNRRRVAGEETSLSWLSDGISRNDGSDIKYESTFASEEESPLQSFRTRTSQKSPLSERTAVHLRTPTSDHSISRNTSMDVSLEQVKESTESPPVSYPSPKVSLSLPSASSLCMSPASSQSQLQSASSNTQRWARHSPGHRLLHQLSDSRIAGLKSPIRYSITEDRPLMPPWSNESARESRDGSSDGWSMAAFSELMASSHKENQSFDNESFGLYREKISRYRSRISTSRSIDLQTCGACSKLLSERSLWSSQKIVATNDLSVVAVLTCGHVYHSECLENMTPEIDKYDPTCPVCTLGEKKIVKLSEKAMRAELEFKSRNNKRSRNRVVDSDLDGDFVMFDRLKSSGHEEKGPKIASSSSMKSSIGRPFLRRHFSFASKGSRSPSENQSTKKKGFFWTKSSKM